ncbi:P1 family peptidase, partial [Streptomyces sparsus]
EAVQRAASDAGRGQPSGSAQGGGEDAPVTVAEDDAAQGSAAPGETSRKAAAGNGAEQGNVGAGAGAVAGGLKGGVGTAAVVLPSGAVVGALVVVNAVGSVVEPTTGALYGELMDGRAVLPAADRHRDARRRLAEAVAASGPPPLNTTLAVVATDAVLSKAQAQKMAGTAHDGLARAVRPVHLLHDGDTVFALATGTRPTFERRHGNPLFRVQYAHARTRALLTGADDLGFTPEPGTYATRAEVALIDRLTDVVRVGAQGDAGRLAHRLEAAADAFFDFHDAHPVLPRGDEKPEAAHRSRLALAEATGTVLAGGLARLGVSAPNHL